MEALQEQLGRLTQSLQALNLTATSDEGKSVAELLRTLPREFDPQPLLREIKSRFQQLENQAALTKKWSALVAEDTLPTHWRHQVIQLPKFYIAEASPVPSHSSDEKWEGTEAYDVEARLQKFMKEQSRSLRNLLEGHYQNALKVAQARTSLASLEAVASDAVDAYFDLLSELYTAEALRSRKEAMAKTLKRVIVILRENSMATMKSRAVKKATAEKKRTDALANAEIEFGKLPAPALIGIALQHAGVKNNEILRRLTEPHKAQLETLGLDKVAPKKTAKPKAKPNSTQNSAYATGKGKGKGKNNDKNSTQNPADAKGKGKGKGKNKSTQPLQNVDKGKGKGKSGKDAPHSGAHGSSAGKGEGKGKSKGKGRGGRKR
eukprot:884172-Amphidinium_carterae.2